MWDLSIRTAVRSDMSALNLVKREASLAADAYRQSLLANPEFLLVASGRVEAACVLLAEVDREIVGMIDVSERPGGIEVEGLFVKTAWWRRGIGRALMEEALARFSDAWGPEMQVIVSPDAEGFYQACGFISHKETSTLFGPAILMRRFASVLPKPTAHP
jgi:GNAT superfamily N-acetyltransferase